MSTGRRRKKRRAVLIGDTRYDAGGALRAGIDCVGISYGYIVSAEKKGKII